MPPPIVVVEDTDAAVVPTGVVDLSSEEGMEEEGKEDEDEEEEDCRCLSFLSMPDADDSQGGRRGKYSL